MNRRLPKTLTDVSIGSLEQQSDIRNRSTYQTLKRYKLTALFVIMAINAGKILKIG